MKRRTLLVIFICMAAVLLTSCGFGLVYNPGKMEKSLYSDVIANSDIMLSVKENNIQKDAENLTLIIANKTAKEYSYGYEQVLEVKINGVWYDVPLKEGAAWIELAVILGGNAVQEMKFQLQNFYEILSPGEYRIVKTFYGQEEKGIAAVEFSITA